MSPDLAMAYCRIIVQALAPDQASLEQLVAGTGVDTETLLTSEGHIDWPGAVQLIRNLRTLSNAPDIALQTGLRALPAVHGPMGMAAMACPTLRDAMLLFTRFINTRTRVFSSHFVETDTTLTMRLDFAYPLDDAVQFLTESALASAYACLTVLLNRPVNDAILHFNYPAPSHVAHYHTAFAGCALIFDAPSVALLLPASYGDIAMPTRDRDMLWLAVQQCEARQESLRRLGTVSDQVLSLLHRHPGHMTLAQAAAILHISPRTLIRRLQKEGTRFQQLQDQTLSRRASQLLSLPHYTVSAVTADLGYTDVASFRRAFRRWFGTSPDLFRQQGRARPPSDT